MALKKVLLLGTSTDYESRERGNLGGFNHAFRLAFIELGWEVHSYGHRQIQDALMLPDKWDLLLLRDVTVDTRILAMLVARSKKFGMFTHAEYIQGNTMDRHFFAHMERLGALPDHLFYDQNLSGECYAGLGINVPGTFIGWGANPATFRALTKDIAAGWFGHNYGERQPRVENLIWPLKDKIDIRIHGRGQPDGPLSMPEMFEVMSRTRIVVRLCHKAHWKGGYSGRTIYDALASGCYVVHDEYPGCHEFFPHGVSFVPVEQVGEEVLKVAAKIAHLPDPMFLSATELAYDWCRSSQMVTHKAQQMIDILFGEGYE